MHKVNPEQLKELIKHYAKHNASLMIYGGPGIGKTMITFQASEEIAKDESREYKFWNNLTHKERLELFNNPEKYYVMVDNRLSNKDNTDLKGLPWTDNGKLYTNWKMPMWLYYFSNPESSGMIFFDEINLAHPSVLASAYQILHDRCNDETALTPKLGIIAAGNRQTDKAYTFDMPLPLRDRLGEVELEFNSDIWFKWASTCPDMNAYHLAFLRWKRTYIYKLDLDGIEKSYTPRGHQICCRMENTCPNKEMRFDIVASRLGEGFATEYEAFLRLQEEIDLKAILENPKLIKDYESKTDLQYSIMAGLSEYYKDDKENFQSCIEVAELVRPDYAVLLLQLMKMGQPSAFKNQMLKNEKASKLLENYFKFFY